MLGWPTVLGGFYLWLEVGLYFPIEPKISGPHNSHSRGGGSPPLGLGWCCAGVGTAKNERDPPNRLAAVNTLCKNWARGHFTSPFGRHVGLYLPIEPQISGPHNSPSGVESVALWVGVAVVQGRYLPKMNEIGQTVWPQSAHFDKIGPHGAL